MSCNETIEDINEVANEYFRNPTEDGKQKLCRMIYEDGSLKGILKKRVRISTNYVNSDDVHIIICQRLITRFIEKKSYSQEKGDFVNYLRSSYKFECLKESVKIAKKQKKEKDYVDKLEGSLKAKKKEKEQNCDVEENVILNDNHEKQCREVFKTIDYFCNISLSGRKSKQLASVFLLQKFLIECDEFILKTLIEKYDFLKVNENLVLELRQEEKVLSGVEFSERTGVPATRVSEYKNRIKLFIESNMNPK